MRGVNLAGPIVLRLAGLACLVLLLWNPPVTRLARGGGTPVVLLDASLSMGARPGQWTRALDTARALARGGVILRFGRAVAAFDTAPPEDGASRLAPALVAAAARGGPITVVTDGAIDDLEALPSDVIARAQVVVLGGEDRAPDAFVSDVTGPHQVAPGDTVTLRVTYGTNGRGQAAPGARGARLTVQLDGRVLAARPVSLPDSGTVSADLPLPIARFPAGWSALAVRIQWPGDSEPRDDARAFPILVTSEPGVVILGAPPDWDGQFLARTLGDVARVPVKYFTQIAPGRWNAGPPLAPTSSADLRRALAGAHLVIEVGDPARWPSPPLPPGLAALAWNTSGGVAGDWYLTPSGGSPLTGALGALPWDSLPPVLAALPTLPDSGALPVLQATLSRRGTPRPVVTVRETPQGRRATMNLTGLYRWDFRGGAPQQAYRTLFAGLVDWLLGGGAGAAEWARPDSLDVPDGMPVTWRWSGPGAPRALAIALAGPGGGGATVDTLRFGAAGRADLALPRGEYRYTLSGGHGRGLVVVDRNSGEWHGAPVLRSQSGRPAAERMVTDWREHGWLFALAVAAFAGAWIWRRRLGLP